MCVERIALFVEDDPILRMLRADMLADEGFEVYQAGNATEALNVLTLHPTTMLLMTDVQMPGAMDGFALAREVARRAPRMAIIVCSGWIRPKPGDMPLGAHFTSKPFSPETIKCALQQLEINQTNH